MSILGCRDVRLALGVYVVGAIDPAERAQVDTHLSHCPECRQELAGLAGLPSLLGRVPASDVERLALDSAELKDLEEPPSRLLRSLLDEVAARRKARRWRVLTAAAAAAVIAVGGGVAGGVAVSNATGHHSRVGSGLELAQGANRRTHVTANVSYAPAASGTTMWVRVSGIPVGTNCEFWVVNASGQRWLAGFWTVSPGAWYHAGSSLAAASLTKFLITSGGKLLVTIRAS